jgi:hypothetical protein
MARSKKASKADIAEVASGRGSASDKREMGFVKKRGRLVPGRTTPKPLKKKFGFKSATKGRGRKRKRRAR